MADVVDTEAEKTAAAAGGIFGLVDDLLLEITRRVHSEKDDRNPRFKLASKRLNSQASEYCTLFRLRLVSRHWNDNFLLPKPFPAAGLVFECGPATDPHSSCIIFLDKSISTPIPFREIDEPWHGRYNKVVHSCNGLLLCARKWAHGTYSVCNPTTGKHSALPQVPPADNKTIRGVSLAFDPCKSPHYKVVCVLRSEDDTRYCQFVVYSSKTGSWGECGELFKTKAGVCFGKGVFWNGSIHWVSSSKLIRFNPGDDSEDGLSAPEVMPMPIARNHQCCYFGESYGHLHYIGWNQGVKRVIVHEMSSDYSAGWVVKYKVDVSDAVRFRNRPHRKLRDFYSDFNVCAVVRGERSEDTFLVLETRAWWKGRTSKIVRLNLHDKTFETIFDLSGYTNPLQNHGEHHHPFQFIESLASV